MAEQYKYVIVGGGMVAGFAGKQLRQDDEEGSILILSNDTHGPYKRPPLTKYLWLNDDYTEDKLPYKMNEDDSIEVRLETTVTKINRDEKTVELQNGDSVGYEKLLLATGGTPRTIGDASEDRVIAYRYQDDYRKLRKFVNEGAKHVLVVGGGFIGGEIAASLTQNDVKVTMVFPEDQLGGPKFPKEIADEYEQKFKNEGVDILSGKMVDSYGKQNNQMVLKLDDGNTVSGDVIILGLGITPNTKLAEDAGLTVDNGVVVNEQLQSDDPDIYVAGDIANYPDQILGQIRVEHEDQARGSGKKAAQNMAGAGEAYTYTPMFYSDVFDISYEAIGTLDGSLDAVIDKVGDGKLAYYIKDNKPVGILIWNTSVSLKEAKNVLSNPPENPEDLKGLIKEKTD